MKPILIQELWSPSSYIDNKITCILQPIKKKTIQWSFDNLCCSITMVSYQILRSITVFRSDVQGNQWTRWFHQQLYTALDCICSIIKASHVLGGNYWVEIFHLINLDSHDKHKLVANNTDFWNHKYMNWDFC